MKNHWKLVPLGELCDILDSRRKPVTKRDRQSGIYPYYGATGILDYVDDYLFDELLVLVGEDGAKWGAGENTAFSVSGKCWVNNHAHVLRPYRNMILDNWLIYFLNQSDLTEFVSGLTVPKLNQGNLREIPIPIAPLSEQQRIVAILDQAFDAIARARAIAGQNRANARIMFENYLQSMFNKYDSSWVEKRIDQIGITLTGSTPDTSNNNYFGSFIPFIKPSDFNKNGTLDYENAGLSEMGLEISRVIPSGSVLMVCIGTIGKCGYNDRDITANQQINAVIPNRNYSQKLIYYQMSTRDFQRRVLLSSAQTTLPIINKSKWSSLTLVFPSSFKEQECIVGKCDDLFSQIQRLDAIYLNKVTALDDLKSSLLHQAFTGQL